ncbi:pre-mRNA-processing factor 19, partial [Tremellales sp. Uapishka_1]
MFFCAISGSPPVVPVVSKLSGTVYEKALIERYIESNGTDPVSGEALTKEDLIEVKAKPNTLPPRASTQTSIPALLTSLQSEYDSIMLESLEIKKAFNSSRQELANALYREDAATRVIARLMKERDESREALASIQATIGFAPAADDVEMAPEESTGALPKGVEARILDTSASLSSVRKKRKPAPGYVTAATLKTYTQTTHVPSLHATKPAGIAAIDLASDSNKVLTGGNDKVVQLYDLESSKVVGTCKGHTKAVTHVAFINDSLAVSSSADKTVKIWGQDSDAGKWVNKASISSFKGEVTGLAVHPTKTLIASASTDSTWSLYDIEASETVATYSALSNLEGGFSYSSFAVHPDGILHGGGTKDGLVRVWDARQSTDLAASLQSTGHEKGINSLSFSENGYYLATSALDSPTINIFDLRKLQIISTWNLPAENTVSEVRFDTSAQFLSVAGTDLRIYANKTWDELYKFDDNAAVLTGARFGALGQKIVLGGLDRTLRVLGAAAE